MPVFTRSQTHALADRYRCVICQDLLIEPVSVTCGHTFCRLCLAKWTLQCKQTKCAQCQQFWNGQPQVNIVLRETVQEMFSDAYAVRAANHNLEAAVVDHFDRSMRAMLDRQQQQIQQSENRAAANQTNTNVAFFTGIGISVILGSIVYLLGFRPAETYVVKPVASWTLMDSMHWLDGVGDWTKENLVPTFAKHHLDGDRLLGMIKHNNSTLTMEEVLTKETGEHQQFLQKVFNYILLKEQVPPADLWEFKDVYPLKTLVFLELFFTFPRLGPLLMYFCDYRGSFLPLIHVTTGALNISIYDTELPTPSLAQYMNFVARLIFFPFLTVYMKFLYVAAWPTNPWVALWTGWRLLMNAVLNINFFVAFIKNESVRIQIRKNMLTTLLGAILMFVVFYLTSWILPKALFSLVCSIFFYINFLALPVRDTFLAGVLLFALVNYVQQTSRAELWNEAKAFWTSLVFLLQAVLDYLRNDAMGHCWQLATAVYQFIKALVVGTIRYITHSALGDLWSLTQFFYKLVVSMVRYVAHFAVRQMGLNEQ